MESRKQPEQGGWGSYLGAKAFNEAPVRDVADLSHQRQIQHRVAQHAGLESFWVLTKQMAGQEASMRATHDCYPVFLNPPCSQKSLQYLLTPSAISRTDSVCENLRFKLATLIGSADLRCACGGSKRSEILCHST